MGDLIFALIIIIAIIFGICAYYYNLPEDQLNEKVNSYDRKIYGEVNREIICPHCQNKGHVHVKKVKRKQGVSGGKATAAILTSGVSLLATGLARKEDHTQAYCSKCEILWDI